MRNSLSLNFFLIIFLCTLVPSLVVARQKGKAPVVISNKISIFDTSFDHALYRGSLDISSHHLSGLFYLKRISSNSVRIVFSNEFGLNFFDIEVRGNSLIVHSCFPSLNRKALLKLIKNDFRLLMIPDPTITKMKPVQSSDSMLNVFSVRSAKGSFIYSYDKSSGKLIRIQTSGSILGKTDLIVSDDDNSQPKKINISNPTIRLHLHMTFLST